MAEFVVPAGQRVPRQSPRCKNAAGNGARDHICRERSFDGPSDAAGSGKFADVQIVGVERNLNRTRVRERPVAKTNAEVERHATAVSRFEFAIAEMGRCWTYVDAGAQQLPLGVVDTKVGCVQ